MLQIFFFLKENKNLNPAQREINCSSKTTLFFSLPESLFSSIIEVTHKNVLSGRQFFTGFSL